MHALFLAVAVLVSAAGQVQFKIYALNRSKWAFVSTVILFLLAPIFSYLALKGIGVDAVYMATSLNTFIVLLLSKYLLDERVQRGQLVACLVVVAGVVVYLL
jgi:drug/metabolite transporter (DMT)-like permease